MTLSPAGTLEGRGYARRQDPRTGETRKWVCLECGKETSPTRRSFVRHSCIERAAPSAATAADPAGTDAEDGNE